MIYVIFYFALAAFSVGIGALGFMSLCVILYELYGAVRYHAANLHFHILRWQHRRKKKKVPQIRISRYY